MRRLLIGSALCAVTALSSAMSTIDGKTFSVTTDTDYYSEHPYGYITSDATAGMWGHLSEWIVVRSEFDLAGSKTAQNAILSFTFNSVYNIRWGAEFDYDLVLPVTAYVADNIASVSDYTPLGRNVIGEFHTLPLVRGDTISFDVTDLFNAAVRRGDAGMGVGIDQLFASDTFVYFENNSFKLSVVPEVPEPSTYAFMLAGIALLLYRKKRVSRPNVA
jgi:hypothetical protein